MSRILSDSRIHSNCITALPRSSCAMRLVRQSTLGCGVRLCPRGSLSPPSCHSIDRVQPPTRLKPSGSSTMSFSNRTPLTRRYTIFSLPCTSRVPTAMMGPCCDSCRLARTTRRRNDHITIWTMRYDYASSTAECRLASSSTPRWVYTRVAWTSPWRRATWNWLKLMRIDQRRTTS